MVKVVSHLVEVEEVSGGKSAAKDDQDG